MSAQSMYSLDDPGSSRFTVPKLMMGEKNRCHLSVSPNHNRYYYYYLFSLRTAFTSKYFTAPEQCF